MSKIPVRHITSLPFDISEAVKNGSALAGNDFTEEQLGIWFSQEQEAFYSGDAGNSGVDPWYAYMRYVNERLAFSLVERTGRSDGSMLVIGPGSGKEVDRFVRDNSNWKIHFIEASLNFKAELRTKFPKCVIVEPVISGDIALKRATQDVVCAFSVLHHIPNVAKVLAEVSRVAKPGALFFVREPCSSMGDWRYARSATPNERGISRSLLIDMAKRAGFEVASTPIPILLEPINKVLKKTIGFSAIPFGLLYAVDRLVSKLVSGHDYYWRDTWLKKIGPSSYFYVFRKRQPPPKLPGESAFGDPSSRT